MIDPHKRGVSPTLTVAELIAILQRCEPDMPVAVDGYEGGYDAVTPDRVFLAQLKYRADEYCGDRDLSRFGTVHCVISRGSPPGAYDSNLSWMDIDPRVRPIQQPPTEAR